MNKPQRRTFRSGYSSRPQFLLSYCILLCALIVVLLSGISFETRLLRDNILIGRLMKEGVNYDAFREMRVSESVINRAETGIARVLKKYPDLRTREYMDPVGYLTLLMLTNEFKEADSYIRPDSFLRFMSCLAATDTYRELYQYYKAVLSDLEFFPVPRVINDTAEVSYTDTWNVLRSYGGNRRHEGTDLMSSNNIRGYFPVVSMTDGVIEKLGWLEQGGNRIGIRSASGGYYYYAHLDSYAFDLEIGTPVVAGQLIGFMGDTGYGEEGTMGKFDVHLHLGIYINTKSGEMSVNPYQILKMLENNRTQYTREPCESN